MLRPVIILPRPLPATIISAVAYQQAQTGALLNKRAGRRTQMPTQITQFDEEGGARTTLRIAGSLTLADAELLARICAGLQAQRAVRITLDLSELSFLDSESAAVLTRLKEQHGVALDGVHLFVQQVIDQTEQERG